MAEVFSDYELKMLGRVRGKPPNDVDRFLDTITAERKRIDKATDRIHTLEKAAVNVEKTIADQTATIERMKTAIHDCIERPKGVVPDSAIEFYDMRGPAIIEKPDDQALDAGKE